MCLLQILFFNFLACVDLQGTVSAANHHLHSALQIILLTVVLCICLKIDAQITVSAASFSLSVSVLIHC